MLPIRKSKKAKFFFYVNLKLAATETSGTKLVVKKKTTSKFAIVRGYGGPKSSFIKYRAVHYSVHYSSGLSTLLFSIFAHSAKLVPLFASVLSLTKIRLRKESLLIL